MAEPEHMRSLTRQLSELGLAVGRGVAETMAPYRLHPRAFRLLRAISREDGQSQQSMCDREQIPPSRMVAMVDQLEERGLVERRAHAGDRRIRELHLTDEGRVVASEAMERLMSYERRLTAALTAEQREQLHDLLELISVDLDLGTARAAGLEEQSAPNPIEQGDHHGS